MNFLRTAFFLLLAGLAACGNAKPAPSQKPLVLVSIAPYKLFASRIGGDCIEAQSIVPQSANAHTFEPTPRQREGLLQARIWFKIGEPFEKPLIPLLPKNSRIVDLREGIEMIATEEGASCRHCAADGEDRHIWMSPSLAKRQAETIARTLSAEFPEHREVFEERLSALLADFDKLDSRIRETLQDAKNRSLLVSHPAFGYFCRDFDLKQLSVEVEGKDPRPRHLEHLLQTAKADRPAVALALPQHNNKGVQLLAQELGMRMQIIDPYSSDYFSMMQELSEQIVRGKAP